MPANTAEQHKNEHSISRTRVKNTPVWSVESENKYFLKQKQAQTGAELLRPQTHTCVAGMASSEVPFRRSTTQPIGLPINRQNAVFANSHKYVSV